MTTTTATSARAAAERIFVALDTTDTARAAAIMARSEQSGVGFKLGLEYFTANGADGVRRLMASGDTRRRVFLDLKFHDIPNTVAAAVRAAVPLQPVMLNVHASGGAAMMRAAAEAAADEAIKRRVARPLLLAVTVLTSLDAADLAAVGQSSSPLDQVKRLAALAQACGLDGVVCSAAEVTALRAQCGADFRLVVPGIRPTGAAVGDQKRVMGPREAIAAGADDLVIGRPITEAPDHAVAIAAICAEMVAA